jgi:hypothetical protein
MSRLVFLLEEYSMKVLLDALLPRFFPGLPFLCVPHEGKQDLERSIPRKLQAWREPGARFIVVRDNDDGDCRTIKQRLMGLCLARPDTVVRIACQELEAWYLGDPAALAEAFGDARLAQIGQRARFRDPDDVVQPARALEELVPSFQKVSGARLLGPLLDPARNRSGSFRALMDAVQRLGPPASQEVL